MSFFGIDWSRISAALVFIVSMPAKIISPELPFYSQHLSLSIVMIVLNLICQAFLLNLILRAFKK